MDFTGPLDPRVAAGETATTGFRFISGKKHAPSALKSKRETLRLLPDRYRI
jgi:hypothetical protein